MWVGMACACVRTATEARTWWLLHITIPALVKQRKQSENDSYKCSAFWFKVFSAVTQQRCIKIPICSTTFSAGVIKHRISCSDEINHIQQGYNKINFKLHVWNFTDNGLASFDQKLSGLTANFLEREVKKQLIETSPFRRRRSALDCGAIWEDENSQFPYIPTWWEVTLVQENSTRLTLECTSVIQTDTTTYAELLTDKPNSDYILLPTGVSQTTSEKGSERCSL